VIDHHQLVAIATGTGGAVSSGFTGGGGGIASLRPAKPFWLIVVAVVVLPGSTGFKRPAKPF